MRRAGDDLMHRLKKQENTTRVTPSNKKFGTACTIFQGRVNKNVYWHLIIPSWFWSHCIVTSPTEVLLTAVLGSYSLLVRKRVGLETRLVFVAAWSQCWSEILLICPFHRKGWLIFIVQHNLHSTISKQFFQMQKNSTTVCCVTCQLPSECWRVLESPHHPNVCWIIKEVRNTLHQIVLQPKYFYPNHVTENNLPVMLWR